MTVHPRSLPATPRAREPMSQGTLPLDRIATRPDVLARQTADLDHALVRELVDALRREVQLDRILVWREEGPDGTLTGRFVLLDGEHRLAAYRIAGKRSGRDRKVPVSTLTGPLMEAQLHALAANVRRKLGLTKVQRMDRGWQLVWEHGEALSKSRLARAAGIGVSTVAKMRARRLVMVETGAVPSGEWRRDKGSRAYEGWTDDVPLARREAIAAALPPLRQHLRRKPQLPVEFVAQQLEELVGKFMLESVAHWIAGPYQMDPFEEGAEELDPRRDLEADPQADF